MDFKWVFSRHLPEGQLHIKIWLEASEDRGAATWLQEGAPGPDLKNQHRSSSKILTITLGLMTQVTCYTCRSMQDALDSCRGDLGGADPILFNFGLHCRDEAKLAWGVATTKTCIILDAKRSLVTSATERRFASGFPRIADAVHGLLSLIWHS